MAKLSVPSKFLSDTRCTDESGGASPPTAGGSTQPYICPCDPRGEYGSECGWRLSSSQIPAYPMIVDPDPGSIALASARLSSVQLPLVPFHVWSALNWCPISCATKSTPQASPVGDTCPVQPSALMASPTPAAASPPPSAPRLRCPMS